MIQKRKSLFLIFLLFLLFLNAKTLSVNSVFKDEHNNLETHQNQQAFKSIKIGSQIWMTQNLNVSTYSNGDFIREVNSKEEWNQAGRDRIPAYCYYEFNSKNNTKYGKLYNWYAVNAQRKLAPKGWHIPSDQEWEILVNHLGGKNNAGLKLKSKEGWSSKGNGNNLSAFSALPGGCIGASDFFYNIMNVGFWWSSTNQSNDYSYIQSSYVMLTCGNSDVMFNSAPPSQGFSIRCIKD